MLDFNDHAVTEADFDEKVLKADRPTVVNFFNPMHPMTGPSQEAAANIAERFGEKIHVKFVDVSTNRRILERVREAERSLPTQILYVNGRERARKSGNYREDVMERQLLWGKVPGILPTPIG